MGGGRRKWLLYSLHRRNSSNVPWPSKVAPDNNGPSGRVDIGQEVDKDKRWMFEETEVFTPFQLHIRLERNMTRHSKHANNYCVSAKNNQAGCGDAHL